MGLINREELLNAFGLSENTRKYGGDGSGYDTRMLYEIQDTIEDAEEEDAISVDWIKEYIDAAEEMDGFAAKFVVASITGMLDAWKEEKEG